MTPTHYICKYTPTELLTALGGDCVLLDEAPDGMRRGDDHEQHAVQHDVPQAHAAAQLLLVAELLKGRVVRRARRLDGFRHRVSFLSLPDPSLSSTGRPLRSPKQGSPDFPNAPEARR